MLPFCSAAARTRNQGSCEAVRARTRHTQSKTCDGTVDTAAPSEEGGLVGVGYASCVCVFCVCLYMCVCVYVCMSVCVNV
jgi:hypothetical protein